MCKTQQTCLWLLLALFGALLPLGASRPAAADECIDAAAFFAEEARWLAKHGRKESRIDAQIRLRGRVQEADSKPPEVGDVVIFFVSNLATRTREERAAVLQRVGRHCLVFVEQGRTVAAPALDRVVSEFDDRIYPTNTRWFGREWSPGIDGDERITLLLIDIRDTYDPENDKRFVGGFFYPGDEYTRDQKPTSNEREMLYLDIDPVEPASDRFFGILAHEFQHLIHWHHDAREATWLNEGLSQLANWLYSQKHCNQVAAFVRNPDNSLCAWANDDRVANYGHVYLFFYYLMNHALGEGEERQAAFFRDLVAEPEAGVPGLQKTLQRHGCTASFEQLFARFCVTNRANDPRLENGAYAYDKSLARLRIPPVIEHPTGPSVAGTGDVRFFSADGIRFDLQGLGADPSLHFVAESPLGAGVGLFDLAMVLTDNRDATPTSIRWLKATGNQYDGVLTGVAGKYTHGELVVINRGPGIGSGSEQSVAQAPAVGYQYRLVASAGAPTLIAATQSSTQTAMAPRRLSQRSFLAMLRDAFRTPGEADREQAVAALAASEHRKAPPPPMALATTEQLLIETIRHDLEAGRLANVEALDRFIGAADSPTRQRLQPVRHKVGEIIRFEQTQRPRPELADILRQSGY